MKAEQEKLRLKREKMKKKIIKRSEKTIEHGMGKGEKCRE